MKIIGMIHDARPSSQIYNEIRSLMDFTNLENIRKYDIMEKRYNDGSHYTKDEHGRFTGSTSSGGGGAVALSSRYLNSSEQLYRNAALVEPIDGYEDIFIHGDKTGFAIKDKNEVEHDFYTPREFAAILKNDPNYHGGDIRLLSCETAADGAIAAQLLANFLGVNVLAPTDIVWVDFEGKITIGPDEFTNSGTWVIKEPIKRKE